MKNESLTYSNKAFLKASRPIFPGICGKTYQVEISLHKVENQLSEGNLSVFRSHIIFPLGFYDALP